MRVFLDTSALAKRYVNEPGSQRILDICAEAGEVCLSIVCIPELFSTFNRLKRERKISSATYEQLKEQVGKDVNAASIVPVDHNILRTAIRAMEESPLKASDAIHVASAKEAVCELFVSADRQQCISARRFKLRVEEI